MKVGVSSHAFRYAIGTPVFAPPEPLTPTGLLERSAAVGAEVVQICHNMPLDGLPDQELARLGQCATELGLDLEVGIAGSQPEHLRRSLGVAERLGAKVLRVILTTTEWEPPFNQFVTIFRSFLPDLRAAGVTLAIENHFHLTPKEIARLAEAIDDPLVGVCLDPVNSITKLVGVPETVATLAPFAVSVHAKDVAVTRPHIGFYITGCPLGKGLVDLQAMLDAVRAHDRSPNVLLECWMDPLEDEASTLAQEQAWIRHGITYLQRLVSRYLVAS